MAACKDNFKNTEGVCAFCHWSSKPCTNPSCPNEIGVPTKRCGGCRIDRYCSVECQAEAHPHHEARCKKIQEKRLLAAEKDDREDSASIFSEEGTCAGEDSCSSEEKKSDVRCEISSGKEEEAMQDDESDADSIVHKDLFEEFARDYGYSCISM